MKSPGRILNRLADVAFLPPLAGLWARGLRGRVTCLLYHRVDEPGAHPFLDRGGSPVIPPGELRRELRLLRDLGAGFHTFTDLRRGWFPEPDEIAVIVSFDDGFRSNYTSGLEVLRETGVPGVFFQTTGLIDSEELLWEHELYWRTRNPAAATTFSEHLRRTGPELAPSPLGERDLVVHARERVPSDAVDRLLVEAREELGETGAMAEAARAAYPTAAMIRRAREEGHEIGAHGHRHYKRSTIDAATFEADIARSREILTDLLGDPPGAFSYPFNNYRPSDEAIVARHFEQGVTVDRRRIERETDPLWLPRFTWPGPSPNPLRRRRWLLTGSI